MSYFNYIFEQPMEMLLTKSGSDYSDEVLSMPIQDSCPYCDNTAIKYVQNGEDDYNAEICDCIAGEIFTNELH